jgi:hypothetical protein
MSGKAKLKRIKKKTAAEVIAALPAPDLDALRGRKVTLIVDKDGRVIIKP